MRWRVDVVIALCLSLAAAGASWRGSGFVSETTPPVDGLWFESDSIDFRDQLTVTAYEIETRRHPLVPLLLRVPMRLCQRLFPSSDRDRLVRAMLASASAAWICLLFSGYRLAGCRRGDATLFSAIALTSATAFTWFVVPDIFMFSAVSALPAFLLAAAPRSRMLLHEPWAVGVTALSFSLTMTNVMFGAAATLLRHPWRRALQLVANAGWVFLLLLYVQISIYPAAGFRSADAGGHIYLGRLLHPWQPLRAFFLHSMVMPAVTLTSAPEYPALSMQASGVAATVAGGVAVAAWIGLLLLGLAALRTSSATRDVKAYLAALAALQLILHIAYGEETFLYAPHYLPLLLWIAALGALSPLRRVVLVLGGILLITSLLNNVVQWRAALELAQQVRPVPHGSS